MRCHSCSTDNRPQAKFCSECGSKLEALCPSCNAPAAPGAKFCDECGGLLAPAPAGAPAPKPERPPAAVHESTEAEWRQITVMFCDLVGSTQLAREIDPEDLRELVRAYQEICARIVTSVDGFVARFMGDGVLLYFGYPKAHEDDAERAVRAGLEIVAEIGHLNTGLGREKKVELAVRIGLATGRVVAGDLIGEGVSQEMAILGETPNLAARLQGVAPPNTVVIGPTTLQLVKGLVEHESLGSHRLKGFPDPIEATHVVRLRRGESRFEAAHASRHLTPMVGREDETAMLLRRWSRACSGEGHAVLLSGEPGIGKSRLLQSLIDHLEDQQGAWWRFQCSSQHTSSALFPVISQLERAAGFERTDGPELKLDKLATLLGDRAHHEGVAHPLLAALLAIPLGDQASPTDASPQRRKDQTLAVLVELLHDLGRGQPVLLIFEDVHWIDPTTHELLDHLVDGVSGLPVLIVITFRPDYVPPWAGESYVTSIALSRLSEREGAEMVARLAEDAGLPAEVLEEIVDKTDGVPLFVEELTMLLLESRAHQASQGGGLHGVSGQGITIPSTLQDSLTARLDRLGDAKDIVQIGSAIGREFDYDLLRSVAPWDESVLRSKLARLVDLLHGRGVAPRMRYAFKHALVQEAAYSSLLKRTRQDYHRRIARSLDSGVNEDRESRPELIAHHYTEAAELAMAVDWWLKAGRRALSQSANLEAIHHLRSGLDALDGLPDEADTRHLELALQTSLGPALFATRGYAALEVRQAYARGRELCRQLGDAPELFSVHWGLWAYHVVRADLEIALDTGREMARLAEAEGKLAWRIESCLAVGLTSYFLARPTSALVELEWAANLDTPDRDRSFTALSGQDAVVCSLTYAGLTLWLVGHHGEAMARSRQAIALARELEHPFSLAYALNFGGWLCYMLRDADQALALAEEQIAISEELGFFWTTLGSVTRGWARARLGEVDDGLAEIRQGMQAYRAPGAHLSETILLAMEAEACLLGSRAEEGLERVAEALAAAGETGETVWLPELQRLQGRCHEMLGDPAAETSYRTALDVARGASAPALELRAALDLARTLIREGKAREAGLVLRPARAAVTGGTGVPDLYEADVLLAEIEQSA